MSTATQDLRLEQLLAKQDIQECLVRFARGMDRFDQGLYLSAFWEDAEIAAGPFVGTPLACWNWAVPMHEAGQTLTQHALLQTSIDLAGDQAHAETYYQFTGRNRDESLWLAGGRYIDRLEMRQQQWRIALRTNLVEWCCLPPSAPLPFAGVPDLAANGISSRSTDDPSYFRPLRNHRRPQTPAAD